MGCILAAATVELDPDEVDRLTPLAVHALINEVSTYVCVFVR